MNRSAIRRTKTAKPWIQAMAFLLTAMISRAQPSISGFTPASGPVGTSVTITGAQFDPTAANNIVYFGGARAVVTGATSTSLTVKAPPGSTYQPITVTSHGMTAVSVNGFLVTFTGAVNVFSASSFAEPQKAKVGTNIYPYFIRSDYAVGDIDGDGKPDIVTGNSGSGLGLQVYRNTSAVDSITFAEQDFATGNVPTILALGDLDGDGLIDVAVGGTNNGVSILRNQSVSGTVAFAPYVLPGVFAAADSAIGIAIGDMDGDGKPDLVLLHCIAGGAPVLSVYLNTSAGGVFSFTRGIDLVPGSLPAHVLVRDLNGDGKQDIVIANVQDSTISVFQNTSAGAALSFTKTNYKSGDGPLQVVAGDVNGDGKPDLVVANSGNYAGNNSSTISVFLNNSNGSLSFSGPTTYPANLSPEGIGIGDLDGDGRPDIVTGNNIQGVSAVCVMRNTGNGFAAPVSYSSALFTADIAVCDLDGDGYPDILTQSNGAQTILRSLVGVPAAALVPPAITGFTPAGAPAGSSVTISGNHFDSVAGNNIVYFGAVRAKVSAGNLNSLTVTVPREANYAPLSVTTSQRLSARSNMSFDLTFPGAGGPPFTGGFLGAQSNLYAPVDKGNMIVVQSDVDNDGKPDLVVGDVNADSVFVYRNTGTPGAPSFARTVGFAIATPTDIGVADVDGDGRPDLVVIGAVGITVFVNRSSTGSVAFGPPSVFPFTPNEGIYLYKLAIGDLDGDGQPDLAVTVGGSFSVWKNFSIAGKVQFVLEAEFEAQVGPTVMIALADFNGDGLPDIVCTGGDKADIIPNTSSGGNITVGNGFVYVTTAMTPEGIAVGDIDGDGLPDVVIADYGAGSVSVLRNTGGHGTIAFANSVDLPTAYAPVAVAIADLNGDGAPDLVVTGQDTVALLKNTSSKGSVSFAGYAAYPVSNPQGTGFYTAGSLVVGDLDGDGLPDVAVANLGTVSYFINQELRPVLSSCTPMFLQADAPVTITGFNLSGATAVYFGGTAAASFTVVSSTQITAVASDGTSGILSVTTPYGVAVLPGIVFAGPTVSGFAPLAGPVGSTAVITGTGFSAVPAHDVVRFGSVQATVVNASATSLTVRVPPGSSYQPVSVTVNGFTAWTSKPFDVTFPGIGNHFTSLSFGPHADSASGDEPHFIAIGDLDGDGKPDIAVPNYNGQTTSILVNNSLNGMISFKTRSPISSSQNTAGVSMADLDGDGKLDLVLTNGQNSVSFFLNTTVGGVLSFGPEQFLPASFGGGDYVAVGDIDGDGKADLVAGEGASLGGPVHIFHNTTSNGIVSFEINDALNYLSLGNWLDGIAIQDLDGDGKPEIILSYYYGNSVMVLGNITSGGNIAFNQGVSLNPGGSAWQVAFGDLDGDGKTDLLVTVEPLAGAPGITVYRNTSSPGVLSFANQGYLAIDGTPYGVAVGDIDGDGKPDVAATNMNYGLVSVFKNTTAAAGSISFTQKADYATSFDSRSVAIGDLDGDGKPDLVTGNYGFGDVSILRNQIGEPTVTPSGTNPVTGDIINRLSVDSTVQTLNGSPYVPRHYDIEPVNNAATATATVTLYFTQQDFDAYNAAPNHGADLPHGPGDVADIGNLRIYQYHGFSATSVPGTYSGTGLVIQPADSNIVWDAANGWWAVTFNVSGFSGFFAASAAFTFNQTPAPVITAEGSTHFCGSGSSVLLQSSADTLNQWYRNGQAIGGATGTVYAAGDSGVYTVSWVHNGIASPQSAGVRVTSNAIPAKPVISLSGGNLESSALTGNQWYYEGVLVTGATGQAYHPADTGTYTVRVMIDSCWSPESDPYEYRKASDTLGAVRLVPNPTKGVVTLTVPGGASATITYQAVVVDMVGRVLMNLSGLQNGSSLDLTLLAPGIYSVRVYSSDGKQQFTVRVERL